MNSNKTSQVNALLDKFYEVRIRENKQFVGITPNCGGLQGSFSIIGYQFAEPSQNVVNLITDILLYTKFKLSINQANTLNHFGNQEPLETKGLHMLLKQTRQYLINVLHKAEIQQCISLTAQKVRFSGD
jgi:hypothetical protein